MPTLLIVASFVDVFFWFLVFSSPPLCFWYFLIFSSPPLRTYKTVCLRLLLLLFTAELAERHSYTNSP